MNAMRILVQVILMALPSAAAFAQAGDIWFWLPPRSGMSRQDAQVIRNSKYVSIKLHSLHIYYKSGYFENIKWVLITSDLSLEHQGKQVQATFVNRTWEKSRENGDFIGLGDHLARLSPATPPGIRIGVTFRGVGEDRFKRVFDLLGDKDFKIPLSLSDAAIGRVTAAASIVRRFLATPYTSENPRNILEMSQSFVLYSDVSPNYEDALREGFIVVFSAREKKSEALDKVLRLQASQLRLGPQGQDLQYEEGNTWRRFTGNSYVIFSVTQAPIRGPDEYSTWFRKYTEAERATEKLVTGDSLEKVDKEIAQLWTEGSTLLDADSNYIEEERRQLRASRWDAIQKARKTNIERAGIKLSSVPSLPPSPSIPINFEEIASRYEHTLVAFQGRIVVKGFADTWKGSLRVVSADDPRVSWLLTPDATGKAEKNLLPGEYRVEALVGNSPSQATSLTVDPGMVVSGEVVQATEKATGVTVVVRDRTFPNKSPI